MANIAGGGGASKALSTAVKNAIGKLTSYKTSVPGAVNMPTSKKTGVGIPTSAYVAPGNLGNPAPAWDGGGGGGGGGYVSPAPSGPTEAEKKAAANLESIIGYNRNTIANNVNHTNDMFDIAAKQNKDMYDLQTRQAGRLANSGWYAQQQRIQSAAEQLFANVGVGLNSSSVYDIWDMIKRADDMSDTEVLGTLRGNRGNIDNNYFEAMMAAVNSYNESAIQHESDYRELIGDYAAQLNNINPELAEGVMNHDKRLINTPEWLKIPHNYDDVKKSAIKPTDQLLSRPADAISPLALQATAADANATSAANQDYWTKLKAGYAGRDR